MIASALSFGLFGLSRPPKGPAADATYVLATMAIGASLIALHFLVRRRNVRLAEPVRAGIEMTALGVVFLFALYHLSHVLPFAGPVAVTIDTLIPRAVLHWGSLIPGAGAIALTELIWRLSDRGGYA